MGHCGVWTAWGPWLDCPKCKPYGQSVVVQKRLRECQVDGKPKEDCAGFKHELKKCDVDYCDAEYKNNSQCLKNDKMKKDKLILSNAPWLVSIGSIGSESDTQDWTHKCVGTIITSNAILTSSKCLAKMEGNEALSIKAGAENLKNPEKGRYVETYEVERHESSETNDLAYVYTTKNMHFNNKTQPICLPQEAEKVENLTEEGLEGSFVTFQQEAYHSKIEDKHDCDSWDLDLDCSNGCSKVCVELDDTSTKVCFYNVFKIEFKTKIFFSLLSAYMGLAHILSSGFRCSIDPRL